MDEETYKSRLREIKLSELKVKNCKRLFLAENVNENHEQVHLTKLREITDCLSSLVDQIAELSIDLDPTNEQDSLKLPQLENIQSTMEKSVLENKNIVLAKFKKPSQPSVAQSSPQVQPNIDKESVALRRQQIEKEGEEKKKIVEERKAKVKIDMEYTTTRATSSGQIFHDVGIAEELADLRVRELLEESKSWIKQMEEIKTSKVSINKAVIGLGIPVDALNKLVEKTETIMNKKITELKKGDKDRGLYFLSKTIKEVAVYPPAFGGGKGEDVYVFKDKFVEALTANQVREKDKIEVLKKHLKGEAKINIGDYYATFDLAIAALVENFGQSQVTWDTKIAKFQADCDKPSHWMNLGSQDRVTIINKTLTFLREAEKLAKDHPRLESAIFAPPTIKKIMMILPPFLTREIVKNGSGNEVTDKQKIKEIREFLEAERKASLHLLEYGDELKHSQVHFGSASVYAFGHKGQGDKKEESHNCSESSICVSEWGLFGCIKLYQLAMIDER